MRHIVCGRMSVIHSYIYVYIQGCIQKFCQGGGGQIWGTYKRGGGGGGEAYN